MAHRKTGHCSCACHMQNMPCWGCISDRSPAAASPTWLHRLWRFESNTSPPPPSIVPRAFPSAAGRPLQPSADTASQQSRSRTRHPPFAHGVDAAPAPNRCKARRYHLPTRISSARAFRVPKHSEDGPLVIVCVGRPSHAHTQTRHNAIRWQSLGVRLVLAVG